MNSTSPEQTTARTQKPQVSAASHDPTVTLTAQHIEGQGNEAAVTNTRESQRAYEKTGCYPEEGKAFRLWALLGWLSVVIIVIAGASAVLNNYLLQ